MFEDLEYRRAEIERHRENSARLAQAFAKFQSTGQGSTEFVDVVDFGLTFIEEPFVSYGAQLDLDALSELMSVDPSVTPQMPLSTGYVTGWEQNDRGFYTGAWVAVTVHFASASGVASTVNVHMQHHFTFTAIALKDVPLDVRD